MIANPLMLAAVRCAGRSRTLLMAPSMLMGPRGTHSRGTTGGGGGHIETDMQEKRRADEDRYVRERDQEALKKLVNQVRACARLPPSLAGAADAQPGMHRRRSRGAQRSPAGA